MASLQPALKDLSIIIPVYNAMDVLPRCIDSILGQTADLSRVEVLLVDDGSTDGSGALCDNYEREYPDLFRIIHQENSGGPASPRNQGIRTAQGTYVFFCDNDDYFGVEAVERMLAHAFEWNSDVLLARLGKTTRITKIWSLFMGPSIPKADLYESGVVGTLGPWKLFRRSLLLDNDVWFPEDCSLDDSVFTLRAYLFASIISIACDYDYYFWTIRDDRGNLSSSGGSPSSTWRKVNARLRGTRILLRLIQDYADSKKALPLYVKVIGHPTFNTLKLIAQAKDAQDEFNEACVLLSPFISEAFLARVSFEQKVVFTCLKERADYERFKGSVSAGKRGVVGFYYLAGVYVCQGSFEIGNRCEFCHRFVESNITRIRDNKGKKKNELSDTEKTELLWLKKEEIRKVIGSSLLGRQMMRFVDSKQCKRIYKLVKRTVFQSR